jgi:TorA maturation chaperone TorD
MNPDLSQEEAIGTSGGADPLLPGVNIADVDDVNSARADEYALLATLLLAAPDADLLARLSGLQGDPETPLGLAHVALGQAAASAAPEVVGREYFELFVGVGRGELLPYASYYLTGFLNERPLARLRGDMKRLGLERAEGHFDPEDHLGTLCEIMSGFAAAHFVVPAGEEREFFEKHIAPWAGRFFADLEGAASARFYRAVGALGRIFIDIEAEGFAMEVRRSS